MAKRRKRKQKPKEPYLPKTCPACGRGKIDKAIDSRMVDDDIGDWVPVAALRHTDGRICHAPRWTLKKIEEVESRD